MKHELPKGWKIKTCQHPEHAFPSMVVLQPGVHTHTCPGCGKKTTVVQRENPTLSVQ